LDALNFFLADVREGLGPYLAIYLLTEQKWNEANIGIVMAGIAVQTRPSRRSPSPQRQASVERSARQ
jgi:hypothetical protein